MAVAALFIAYIVIERSLGTTRSFSVAPTTPAPSVGVAPASPLPARSAASSPKKGLYRDGEYTGAVADAYFGNVQVKATIQAGKIADVQFLQYPSDRSTSQEINAVAMPSLQSEAIQAQSANVDIVSGATQTSLAFQQSLADALSQAST